MSKLEKRITNRALEIGFDAVGIAPAEPGGHLPFYLDWLAAGHHGEQTYLARPDRLERRGDLNVILPNVQSLIVVGRRYWPGPPPLEASDPARGRISCYAQGLDYHHLMRPMLETLLQFVQSQAPRPIRGRAYVDTGPLMERDHALRAGLGFVGKNCNLIEPRHGSWLFLGVLMLDLPLEPAQPGRMPSCGACTRCLEACPTGAILRPHTLDSRLCISYLTTALKGAIPRERRPLVGNHIFGCDVCQEVCPWNRFAAPRPLPFREELDPTPSLVELIGLGDDAFQARFGRTPIGQIKRERFLRNVAVALGNGRSPAAVSALEGAMRDVSSLVREHVAWALGRIGNREARSVLESAWGRERGPTVIQEIELALAAP